MTEREHSAERLSDEARSLVNRYLWRKLLPTGIFCAIAGAVASFLVYSWAFTEVKSGVVENYLPQVAEAATRADIARRSAETAMAAATTASARANQLLSRMEASDALNRVLEDTSTIVTGLLNSGPFVSKVVDAATAAPETISYSISAQKEEKSQIIQARFCILGRVYGSMPDYAGCAIKNTSPGNWTLIAESNSTTSMAQCEAICWGSVDSK
jgi:hypothetical protein